MTTRALLASILILMGTAVLADDPAPKVIVRSVDDHDFPRIHLDFELKRPDGSPILDAQKTEFRVWEDNQPVDVLEFSSPVSKTVKPASVVLVVDRSYSMRQEERIDRLKEAVDRFLQTQPEGSQIAVVAFSNEVRLICEFTTDREKVHHAVQQLWATGTTRFYDAVAEALELLSTVQGRRAVVAMTDGDDTSSQFASLESVIEQARQAGLPVHTVGVGSEEEIKGDALRLIARETRGEYFRAENAESLKTIYEEIARSLKQSYSLTYKTLRPVQDGTLRPIRVDYARSPASSGEAAVYIPGMVVPSAGWSGLFVLIVAGLGLLFVLPGRRGRSQEVRAS
jgi:VWFA-related protein